MDSGLDLDEVRIEGHASSEWTGARSVEDAFLRNLHFSQARAEAVLSTCLALETDPLTRAWAIGRMAAVGYSSARPVLVGGKEDAPQFRRVAFNVSLSPDRIFEDLGYKLETDLRPTAAPQP